MRVAINLLTDDPHNPSGAHWFWTRVVPEIAARMTADEELHLLVSPLTRPMHEGYGDKVHYVTFPWSNERRNLRTLTEHVYAPVRLPLAHIDVFNTLMAPLVNPTWALVIHMKTLHAYTTPGALTRAARLYRQMNYPRSARLADAIVINSESLRADLHKYLDVDDAKLHLIQEAVDHDVFRPGDRGEATDYVADRYGIHRPFVLFVSSLWPYKNCEGLIRAFAIAKPHLDDRQLVVVGPGRDEAYLKLLTDLTTELGVDKDVRFVGGVPLEETARFYRAADVLVYPSFYETFGLPLLEAMACGCPVVTSDVSAMPETAGGAAVLSNPHEPGTIADAIVEACGPRSSELVRLGLARAGEVTWAATAAATLDVYRLVHQRRQERRKR